MLEILYTLVYNISVTNVRNEFNLYSLKTKYRLM